MSNRLLLMLALVSFCVLPAWVASQRFGRPFYVKGRVYCDTCRAGFETTATTYIAGASVRVRCQDRKTLQTVFEKGAVTDSSGTYSLTIEEDQQDQICHCELVNSPLPNCNEADAGRNRSSIVLTRYNGVVNDHHAANPMGFLKDKPLPGCTELLKYYLQDDE